MQRVLSYCPQFTFLSWTQVRLCFLLLSFNIVRSVSYFKNLWNNNWRPVAMASRLLSEDVSQEQSLEHDQFELNILRKGGN
jgi:hypothetical protein